MLESIRVLLVEDNPADAELVLYALHSAGFEANWRRVDTEDEFLASLDGGLDIVISDYSMPRFSGTRALELLKERAPEVPFISVSGTMGEEAAVEVMRRGATDYLLKDRLARLGPAVSQALEQTRLRKERRQLEEQIRQAQKMDAFGQLAGGVAHDFNNILTIIQSYASMLEDGSMEGAEVGREISAAVERGAALSRQLLTFSRKQAMQLREVDLNAVVADMTSMLRRTLGTNLRLVVETAPNLPHIDADQSMLQQILLNLAVNARDAMPDGGQLSIATGPAWITETDQQSHPEVPTGPGVCLCVSDDGCGIPPENLDHIFEPFFTTKDAGKGTGLGLATVHSIVKQHHGWIRLSSRLGEGTTFEIIFPARS